MADVDIREVRAFEPRCVECGESGPIESSAFWAMRWSEEHACLAIRIDTDPIKTDPIDTARIDTARINTEESVLRERRLAAAS